MFEKWNAIPNPNPNTFP